MTDRTSSTTATLHAPRGSLWHRWDLHFHTPSSHDYANTDASNRQIVDGLVNEGVRVVAITDHHTIDVARIRELQNLGADKLTVLPGIELRSELGGKESVHFIGIFAEDCDIGDVWTKLSAACKITSSDMAKKGDAAVYCDLAETAKLVQDLGGIVTIHGHGKANSIEGIANSPAFKAQLKIDLLRDCVDILEIGVADRQQDYFEKVFPSIQFELPLIVASDCHDHRAYSPRSKCWLRADPTFRGLLMVLREPRDRVFLGDRPPELVRVEQNRTKYIRGISFARKAGAATSETWFSGEVPFNTGLVAIVGNKGSGKSALADTLGLLGATRNSGSFSFLSKERFRHPASNLAASFEATLEWESGDSSTKGLGDPIKPEEVERLRYLPQDHVERVCNELAGIGEEGFERELKAVIFSHVPEPQRLGHVTLDDLVRFQTDEKQKRIDSLLKQLREASRSRAALEAQADPVSKRGLVERINRRKLELDAHDKAKPAEVLNPAATADASAPDASLLAELADAEAAKKELVGGIANAAETLRTAERRHAVAVRLLEKLDNFQKDFDVYKMSLEEDASELGLKPDELVTLTFSRVKPENLRDEATNAIALATQQLDAVDPPGLRKQFVNADAKIAELQSKLDAPNRAYQAYLQALASWQAKRAVIEGSEQDTESLKALQLALAGLDQLPAKIAEARGKQATLAIEIHGEKLAQVQVFRALYGPVQAFIDSHVLTKDKLKLEFRAELTNEDFAARLLSLLALNRRGSFMGIDEGKARAETLADSTRWDDPESVRSFLDNMDKALHVDLRDSLGTEVLLKDQLLKGKKPEEVFDLLYGAEYVRPRYILRWDGKDLSMLSPGERGTLLLVFYLLIDKSDMPLVIDQPEGNLDNHTVAKVLVECIKEARKRRQVFIVTHNPNLAVVCDADQVVHAAMDKAAGNAVTYTTGALENPAMSQFVTDVLEGTRWAFRVREGKYAVGE